MRYSIYESKKEDFHAMKEAKKKDASRRRDSMAARTEAARRIKEAEEQMDSNVKEEEKSLLDFRYTAWVGEKEYKKKEVTDIA